jgi:isocitrate/isopropylmalate dehydrogenase
MGLRFLEAAGRRFGIDFSWQNPELRTPDLGGKARTRDVGEAITDQVSMASV